MPRVEWEDSPRARPSSGHWGSLARAAPELVQPAMADVLAAGAHHRGLAEILEAGAPPGAHGDGVEGEDARAGHRGGRGRARHSDVAGNVDLFRLVLCRHGRKSPWPSAHPSVSGRIRFDPVPRACAWPRGTRARYPVPVWTEYVPTAEHAEYMYFPRACAFSEVAWSPGRGNGKSSKAGWWPIWPASRPRGQLPASGRANAGPGPDLGNAARRLSVAPACCLVTTRRSISGPSARPPF